MIPISDDEIGGVIVRRRVGRGDLPALLAGQRLSRDEFLALPPANRRALIEGEFVRVLPLQSSPAMNANAERMIVHRGGGLYDVIVGYRLNDEGLTKNDAEELATRPT